MVENFEAENMSYTTQISLIPLCPEHLLPELLRHLQS